MTKDRFKWHFTFSIEPLDEITVEEGHPDLTFIKDLSGSNLVGAALVDVDLFSASEEEVKQFQSVVHSVRLEPCKLLKVFRRVEIELGTGRKRTVPAFAYKKDIEQYCFAFPDTVVLTDNSRFFRETWED